MSPPTAPASSRRSGAARSSTSSPTPCAEHADQPAYSDKHDVAEGEAWRTFTWTDVRERGLDVAAGLIGLGAQVGDTVAIMATNRIEHYVADIGAVHAAATPMSIYNTLSQEQVAYVAGESTPVVAVLENADHLARWSRAIDEGCVKRVVLIDASAAPEGDDRFLSWDELLAAGAERRAAQPDELEAAARRARLRCAGDDPLHVRHHRQPQGRGAHPPQRPLRVGQHAGGRRPRRRAADGELPAARPHRRAGAGPLRPADDRHPRARDRRPGGAARRAGRGAPDGLLRRPARLGEDQDRHLGQARGRRQPRQRQDGAGRDGGGAGLGRGPGGRRHHDAGDRGGLPQGRRGDPRLPRSCCSGSTRSPGPAPRLHRCRSRSPASWPAWG